MSSMYYYTIDQPSVNLFFRIRRRMKSEELKFLFNGKNGFLQIR